MRKMYHLIWTMNQVHTAIPAWLPRLPLVISSDAKGFPLKSWRARQSLLRILALRRRKARLALRRGTLGRWEALLRWESWRKPLSPTSRADRLPVAVEVAESPVAEVEPEALAIVAEEAAATAVEEVADIAVAADLHAKLSGSRLPTLRGGGILKGGLVLGAQEGTYIKMSHLPST